MTTPTSEPLPEPERHPQGPNASIVDLLAMPGADDIEFEPVPMRIGLRAAEFD